MAAKVIRKGLFVALIFFYIVAGWSHFIMPEFYYPLIPDYLPAKVFLNAASGLVELLLAIGLIIPQLRKCSAFAIILLLLCFIPAHIHLIERGGCLPSSLCVSNLMAWLRLFIIHPILIYWAWSFRNFKWN